MGSATFVPKAKRQALVHGKGSYVDVSTHPKVFASGDDTVRVGAGSGHKRAGDG
jgi:hypothetical protein